MKKQVLIILTLLIIFINNFPLISGYLIKKNSLTFLGRRIINSQDAYTYVAFIEQAKQGKILFSNLYTTDFQQSRLLRPSYLLIGKFAAITGISSIAAYHLFRIILSVVFCLVLYKFINIFFENKKEKIITFIIILTSSGLGFLLFKWFGSSIDLWVPEAITFMSLSEAPHFILAQILMLLIFMNFFNKKYFFSGIWLLLLSLEHPFNLVPILVTLTITVLFNRRFSWSMLWILILSGIGAGYQLFELKANLVLAIWSGQNILLSPPPINYLIGYGLLIPLSLVGAEILLKKSDEKNILIISWVFSTFVLVYFPLLFQRRFIEGVHIPMAILAAQGLIFMVNKRFKTQLLTVVIIVLSLSSMALIINDHKQINQESSSNYYYYLLDQEVLALDWLKTNSTVNQGVLANWFYGNLIPGFTGRPVYVGHKIQTPDFNKKIEQIDKFILSNDNNENYLFLKNNNINFIFLGKNDTMIKYGFKPDNKSYLTKVYSNGGVNIYKVN